MDAEREWLDEQVRSLVALYLAGKMDRNSDEFVMRMDGLLIAAGIRRRDPEGKGVALGRE